MGALARSEYTDLESLYSSNSGSRVAEWVKHTTHRDGYVKDAEEELEQAVTQENDVESTVPVVPVNVSVTLSAESESRNTSEPPSVSPIMPVQQLSVPQSSNGYFSEADILLQSSTSSSTAKSTVMDSVTASSSGYNTEQSFTQFQTKTASLIKPAQDIHGPPVQTAYYGAHNPTTNNVCHYTKTATDHTSTMESQLITDELPTADFISSLLFQEEFNPLNNSSHVDMQQTIMTSTPANVPPTQPPGPLLHTPPRKSQYIQHTSSPVPSTVKCSRYSQLADSEEGETDSVFDNSIIPLTHTITDGPQGRTRSSMTSGFCSLSNTSLDSNDNVEMTQIHSHHLTPSPPHSTHPPISWTPTSKIAPTSWTPTSKIAPVIPSLLNTHQPHTPLLEEVPTLPNYENVDDTLKSDDFQFEL